MQAFKLTPISVAVLATLSTIQPVPAEENSVNIAPIVVTATRNAVNSFDLPVAIDVVEQKDIQDGQLQMTLSESLIRVPGITAQNRTQQAQDPQISSRGFGSRSSFGVRGVRVYVDGIPLTMPDGQGQPGVVDLSAIKSIEVMRGPFSSLYGNSSGGVIQMITEDAPQTPVVGGSVMFGSYDTKRNVLEAAGNADGIDYLLNVSNFESNGYRDNSQSDKQQATAKFKFNLSPDTKITALVNWFEQDAQDPLGLTKAGVQSDRKSAVAAAYNANTRVSRNHAQIGFNLEHAIDANNTINLISYVGNRENAQVLATNATGSNARLSEISREFYGSDLRWNNKGDVFGKPYDLSVGLNYGKSSDDRTDTNIQGTGLGANRDENNTTFNFDQYIQGKLSLLDSLDLHAGLRQTRVSLKVEDNLVDLTKDFSITSNAKFRDSSGSVVHKKTTPVIGSIWKVNPNLNLYANFGKGFETPTFIESAYDNASTGTGPNLSIKPSTSNNYELGFKAFIASNTRVNFSVFKINTDKEIIAVSGAPFAVYTNAGKTKRKGIEASIASDFDNNIGLYGSYTLLSAKFDDGFSSVNGDVASGNYIPGTYRTQIYGEASWKYEPIKFKTAIEARYNSKVYVDDINSESADAYTVFNLRAGLEQNTTHWAFKEYIRVENIFDREYIGSIRVNDSNGRFYEAAAGRNYLLGLNAQYKF